MVSRREAADRAAACADQRADDHHDHGHHEEVGEQQTADSPGHRAGEQSLQAPRRSQFLRVPGAWQQPGRCSAVDLAIGERCEGPVFLCG
jgi:hypothetical protein